MTSTWWCFSGSIQHLRAAAATVATLDDGGSNFRTPAGERGGGLPRLQPRAQGLLNGDWRSGDLRLLVTADILTASLPGACGRANVRAVSDAHRVESAYKVGQSALGNQ